MRVKALRTTTWGTQVAVLEVPARLAPKIQDGGKLRVGHVLARLRLFPRILRCFRGHGFGHISMNCRLKADIYRKCGEPGHGIGDCKETVPTCSLCGREGVTAKDANHIAGGMG
ncbi:uncharacterized protein LOC128892787 [Hylaeus anthracinus]|uniref:uncharacterized protein LOC128892787 n=1 Tax=Hylaeus anthracinus TaxID=313031 RepID=UPI0023B9EE6A|nr:uncharacterized protein LOC128892787 [Hylaeus anthracinus]